MSQQGSRVKWARSWDGTNYKYISVLTADGGATRALEADDLLGLGPNPTDPTLGVREVSWRATVPVDTRQMGEWFRAFMSKDGDPTTAADAFASGSIRFSGQPAVDSTIEINGVTFTFKASGATGPQINLGNNLGATLANIVTVLNASADNDVNDATYAAASDNHTLTITHDTAGVDGNAFTLAASAASLGVVSGPTLTGGARDQSWAARVDGAFPSLTIQTQYPQITDVSKFVRLTGLIGESMSLSWNANTRPTCDLSFMGTGETVAATSADASIEVPYLVDRYVGCSGTVTMDGQAFGELQSATMQYSTGLAREDVIGTACQPFPLVAGRPTLTGSFTVRLASRHMLDLADAKTPFSITLGWATGLSNRVTITIPRVYVGKPPVPVSGPGGVLVSFDWQASSGPDGGDDLFTAIVRSDVSDYYA